MKLTDLKIPPLRAWPWPDLAAAAFFALFLVELLFLLVMLEDAP